MFTVYIGSDETEVLLFFFKSNLTKHIEKKNQSVPRLTSYTKAVNDLCIGMYYVKE